MLAALHQTEQQLNQVLLGKPTAVRLALCCLCAGGHLLLEDRPGAGKTTLAHALAQSVGISYRRVQFTNDLLPADLTGYRWYDSNTGQFEFRAGPLFSQLLLADEINRASSRSQSALLEAMEERQVSLDGETMPLPSPFFVIATQNPLEQTGTQALPESQLDRFMMRLSLGFPDRQSERAMLRGQQQLELQAHAIEWPQLQHLIQTLHISDGVLDYLLDLVNASRNQTDTHALSPRASKALLACARAWAFLDQRDFVTPDDIKAVFVAVANHRLQPHAPIEFATAARQMLERVPCHI